MTPQYGALGDENLATIDRCGAWTTIFDAEYLAVCALQADALITVDPELAVKADGIVPLAPLDAVSVE